MAPLDAINRVDVTPQTSVSRAERLSETGRSAVINLAERIVNDPVAVFKQDPHRTELAQGALLHEMRKDLPQDLLDTKLSPTGERIKNLLGVIQSEVKKSENLQDIFAFNKICTDLVATKGSVKAEKKVKEQLAGLVAQYGNNAFEKTINTYIEHCAEAWQEHHDQKSVNVENKETFKACQDVCKSVLRSLAKDLTNPEMSWEMTGQKMNQFVDSCVAISKTLTYYNSEPQTPAAAEPDPAGTVPLQTVPGNMPNAQSLQIPAGSGNGPITLHINNTSGGGSVGNISHTCNGHAGERSGPGTSDLTAILNSGLSDADKVELTHKYLELTAGARPLLTRLQSVENRQPEEKAELDSEGVGNTRHPGTVTPLNTTSGGEVDGAFLPPSSPTQMAGDVTDRGNETDNEKPLIRTLQVSEQQNSADKLNPLTGIRKLRQPVVNPAGMMTFTPAPGAFTGKAADVARIITSQPIHSHMNRQDPKPEHFAIPASFPKQEQAGRTTEMFDADSVDFHGLQVIKTPTPDQQSRTSEEYTKGVTPADDHENILSEDTLQAPVQQSRSAHQGAGLSGRNAIADEPGKKQAVGAGGKSSKVTPTNRRYDDDRVQLTQRQRDNFSHRNSGRQQFPWFTAQQDLADVFQNRGKRDMTLFNNIGSQASVAANKEEPEEFQKKAAEFKATWKRAGIVDEQ